MLYTAVTWMAPMVFSVLSMSRLSKHFLSLTSGQLNAVAY